MTSATNKKGDLSILIKWFGIISAQGSTGGCFIVALPDMPEGEFFAMELEGLSHSSDVNARPTWLYLCKSRAGNPAMWKHIFLNVIIPLIAASAKKFSFMKDINGQPFRSFLATDGEAVILLMAFDDDVRRAFKEALIDYFKMAPSSTHFGQPLDVGRSFTYGFLFHGVLATNLVTGHPSSLSGRFWKMLYSCGPTFSAMNWSNCSLLSRCSFRTSSLRPPIKRR